MCLVVLAAQGLPATLPSEGCSSQLCTSSAQGFRTRLVLCGSDEAGGRHSRQPEGRCSCKHPTRIHNPRSGAALGMDQGVGSVLRVVGSLFSQAYTLYSLKIPLNRIYTHNERCKHIAKGSMSESEELGPFPEPPAAQPAPCPSQAQPCPHRRAAELRRKQLAFSNMNPNSFAISSDC